MQIFGRIIQDDNTVEELINKIKEQINRKTEQIIANGITYGGVNFTCDMIAQQNFTALRVEKDNLSYPYEIWDGEDSVLIQSAGEMQTFCLTVMSHIETTRRNGKTLRETLDGMSREEL